MGNVKDEKRISRIIVSKDWPVYIAECLALSYKQFSPRFDEMSNADLAEIADCLDFEKISNDVERLRNETLDLAMYEIGIPEYVRRYMMVASGRFYDLRASYNYDIRFVPLGSYMAHLGYLDSCFEASVMKQHDTKIVDSNNKLADGEVCDVRVVVDVDVGVANILYSQWALIVQDYILKKFRPYNLAIIHLTEKEINEVVRCINFDVIVNTFKSDTLGNQVESIDGKPDLFKSIEGIDYTEGADVIFDVEGIPIYVSNFVNNNSDTISGLILKLSEISDWLDKSALEASKKPNGGGFKNIDSSYLVHCSVYNRFVEIDKQVSVHRSR